MTSDPPRGQPARHSDRASLCPRPHPQGHLLPPARHPSPTPEFSGASDGDGGVGDCFLIFFFLECSIFSNKRISFNYRGILFLKGDSGRLISLPFSGNHKALYYQGEGKSEELQVTVTPLYQPPPSHLRPSPRSRPRVTMHPVLTEPRLRVKWGWGLGLAE